MKSWWRKAPVPPATSLVQERLPEAAANDAKPAMGVERALRRLEWTVIRRLDGLLQGDYRTLMRGRWREWDIVAETTAFAAAA